MLSPQVRRTQLELLSHMRLQPPAHAVAASATCGCSLRHLRLQVRRTQLDAIATRLYCVLLVDGALVGSTCATVT